MSELLRDRLHESWKNLTMLQLDKAITFITDYIKMDGTINIENASIRYFPLSKQDNQIELKYDIYNPRVLVTFENQTFKCIHCRTKNVDVEWIMQHAKEEALR